MSSTSALPAAIMSPNLRRDVSKAM
jgi:hypothetical protein